jgi:hypothetical protein
MDRDNTSEFQNMTAQMKCNFILGMTVFKLGDGCVLGLMLEKGIKRLLGDDPPDPAKADGVPRAEVHLTVDDPFKFHRPDVGIKFLDFRLFHRLYGLDRQSGDRESQCSRSHDSNNENALKHTA